MEVAMSGFRDLVAGVLVAGVAGLVLLVPGLAYAAPEQIEVDGQVLVKVGEGTRERLTVDLYQVSLYLPSERADLQRINDPSVPKAFQIEVLYGGGTPDDIPEQWAEELLPPLPEEKVGELRQVYQGLEEGDQLRVTYTPGSSTAVTLNGETVFSDPGAGLMRGLVDVFLGPDPVSEDVRSNLLGRAEEEGWLF